MTNSTWRPLHRLRPHSTNTIKSKRSYFSCENGSEFRTLSQYFTIYLFFLLLLFSIFFKTRTNIFTSTQTHKNSTTHSPDHMYRTEGAERGEGNCTPLLRP